MSAPYGFDATYRGSVVGAGSALDFGRAYRGRTDAIPAASDSTAPRPPDPQPASSDPSADDPPDPNEFLAAHPRRLQPARRT